MIWCKRGEIGHGGSGDDSMSRAPYEQFVSNVLNVE